MKKGNHSPHIFHIWSSPNPSLPPASQPAKALACLPPPCSPPGTPCHRTQDAPDAGEGRDVVLFFGIIDILTSYNITKRLEVASKALSFLTGTHACDHSAVPPHQYSTRFQEAMRHTFI